MSMSDPVADMLARIRNAIMARKENVDVPLSKIKRALCSVLGEEGFIEGYEEASVDGFPVLRLRLKWKNGRSAIEGLRRISRPGRRVYVSIGEIPRVREGLGSAVLTTSIGLLTDRQAREKGLGGEVLCEIW